MPGKGLTLLCILATLLRPTSGKLKVAGVDPLKAGLYAPPDRLSVLQNAYDDLTAEQNLRFSCAYLWIEDAEARIAPTSWHALT